MTLATRITADHVCTSAAISLVFQPVRLKTAHGPAYFGDGSDLMNYLPFTPKYTRALIDIGYRDADARIDEIEEFLYSDSNRTSGDRGEGRPGQNRQPASAFE